ncbi:ABC-type transporter MlaC component [Streptosporangium becharense]|uniref:ABC-type transporter MlaC component n=1 Tax=Streptosporangium becharense TaxID=1816182 RepID=A0A7W9MKJ5_9ACTN|nr:ABC-type transporter MlaC component [Streptosporangium becharense]MBB5823604.1 ABC-type transporter MlaC component [Streptosporangium becharense]
MDFLVEGLSIVSGYQPQFAQVIGQGRTPSEGIDKLINTLADRLKG